MKKILEYLEDNEMVTFSLNTQHEDLGNHVISVRKHPVGSARFVNVEALTEQELEDATIETIDRARSVHAGEEIK